MNRFSLNDLTSGRVWTRSQYFLRANVLIESFVDELNEVRLPIAAGLEARPAERWDRLQGGGSILPAFTSDGPQMPAWGLEITPEG